MPSGRQPNHTFTDSNTNLTIAATSGDYETWQMERLTIVMDDAVDLTNEERKRIAKWFHDRYSDC